jgi:phosphoribosylamine--glycine ligase
MKILLLGSGGREHALAWKMSRSSLCSQLFIAPGNPGTAQCGANIDIAVNDIAAIRQFCQQNQVEMVVVGPEDPLVNGVYDNLTSTIPGIKVIGPSKHAAQLEGSKAFAKEFMLQYSIPTAAYEEFTIENFEDGKKYLRQHSLPIVLKADGLAAGKGVVICQEHAEALKVFEEMILLRQFGEASAKVVVEQFLDGIEVSVFVLTDGKDYQVIGHAKDYKRIGEGDTGPNTGGMGCVSPVPFADDVFMEKVRERIIEPTINGFHQSGFDYKGFVFFGLIKVGDEPYVIEYNCRMGDPETEIVMPLLKNDIVPLFNSVYDGSLSSVTIEFEKKSAAVIMLVSGGYPGLYAKGKAMHLPTTYADDTMLFHAGTAMKNDELVTNGGRVLAISSVADTITEAVRKSSIVASQVGFEGSYFRNDIGYEFAVD